MERPQGTVLCVDDDEMNRRALSYVFREAGFEVKEAATGREALRLAAEKPDLIVLDVHLPDIDGLEVCRRIRAHPSTRVIPVLHLTAKYVTSQEKVPGPRKGADGYLTKPVEPQQVVAQARALVRARRAEQKARAAARHWQATFNAVPDGVCLLDEEGRVVRCNRALERILRKPAREIVGRTCRELTLAPEGPGEGPGFPREREAAELPLGGHWLRAVTEPLPGEDGAGAVCVLSDVTARKHLEEQLRQCRKGGATGRRLGALAHDFNNLLTVVAANVAVLLPWTQEGDVWRELLLGIDRAATQAAELARQLLQSSRQAGPRSPQRDGEAHPLAFPQDVDPARDSWQARHLPGTPPSCPDGAGTVTVS